MFYKGCFIGFYFFIIGSASCAGRSRLISRKFPGEKPFTVEEMQSPPNKDSEQSAEIARCSFHLICFVFLCGHIAFHAVRLKLYIYTTA